MTVHFLTQFAPDFETAFSRQSAYIIEYLKEIGVNYRVYTWERAFPQPFMHNRINVAPWKTLFAEVFSSDDILLFQGEYWAFPLELKRIPMPFVWYTPVDTAVLPWNYFEVAAYADLIVSPTEFGRQVLLKHGYSSVHEEPIPNTVRLAETMEKLPKEGGMVHIGTVLRPQRRKNVPGLVRCLSRIKEPFMLHCVSEDELGEYCLSDIFKQYDIKYRLYTGVDNTQLRRFYNTIDLYVNTSMAEGFDLPTAEALLAGKCVLVSDSPVHQEMIETQHNRIKMNHTVRVANGSEWGLIDVDDFEVKYKALRDFGFPATPNRVAEYANPEAVLEGWRHLITNFKEIMAYYG